MNKICHLFCSCPLEIKHLIAEPLGATNIGLLWLFLQTLLMSIYCKRHVQCSFVSTQPHKAFDFVLTLCLCVHRHQIICDLTWAECDMWLGQSWLGRTSCQTELFLVETRPMHVWGCDSGITWMPSRRLCYTNENNSNQMH